ncbi:L-ribulose-5-phosphate 3-epimerase [Acholeplasma sp. OttesenSCG-928-E16]|nr:L-ribulose-5-phosphate 3-epimerase [Acholeplasma sp. OttesenSCG-928-E16]
MSKKYQLGVYEKAMPNNLSIEEKIMVAKKSGFDFLELSIDDSEDKLARLDMNKKQIEKLRNLMFKEDFYIQSICFSGHRKYPLGSQDKQTRKMSRLITEKAVDLAYKLGIRYIQIAGYDTFQTEENEESREYFIKNLKRVVEIASKKGVILAFETMENKFMDTTAKAMTFIKEINNPYLQLYPDIGNLTNSAFNYKSNEITDLRLGCGHIIAVHLKETLPYVYRNLNYGEGHTNYIRFLTELTKQNVFTYCAKFWDNGSPDYEERLEKSRQFLAKKIDDAWSVRHG